MLCERVERATVCSAFARCTRAIILLLWVTWGSRPRLYASACFAGAKRTFHDASQVRNVPFTSQARNVAFTMLRRHILQASHPEIKLTLIGEQP